MNQNHELEPMHVHLCIIYVQLYTMAHDVVSKSVERCIVPVLIYKLYARLGIRYRLTGNLSYARLRL